MVPQVLGQALVDKDQLESDALNKYPRISSQSRRRCSVSRQFRWLEKQFKKAPLPDQNVQGACPTDENGPCQPTPSRDAGGLALPP